jgi:hypothetical protein
VNEPTQSAEAPPVEADLSRTYVLVLAIELLVLVALYWLGRYFS